MHSPAKPFKLWPCQSNLPSPPVICPKCQHERTEVDSDVMEGVCPKCGIAYNKWQAAEEPAPNIVAATEAQLAAEAEQRFEAMYPETLWQRLYRYACFMPSDRHESAFWGHLLIFVFFLVWGLRFIAHGIDWTFVGGSFLHMVNLPFHEYGHLMFSPFGTYMMFLGGSLFQILLPLMPLFVFMVRQRDNFPASIMLWWVGQNFIDVSVYIADAPTRAIPLTTGNDDSHDWWNLLSMTGDLDSAGFVAGCAFLIGTLIMLFSNAWGAHLLWIELKGRTEPGFTNAEQ